MEEWRQIKGYEGLYNVSSLGVVVRIDRNKVMKQTADKDGYLKVCLCKNNEKKTYMVHRLVATAFLDNSEELPVVNHKDENKANNCVDNLEWCSIQYNTVYNGANFRRAISRKKPIIAEKDGKEIEFESIIDASKSLNLNHANVSGILHGYRGRKRTKGYSFRFKEVER